MTSAQLKRIGFIVKSGRVSYNGITVYRGSIKNIGFGNVIGNLYALGYQRGYKEGEALTSKKIKDMLISFKG